MALPSVWPSSTCSQRNDHYNVKATMQILLKGGILLDPGSGRDEQVDILVRDGRIESMGKGLSASAAQVIDLKGKIITPGLIDMHVHLREPGYEHKETILTGCSAAA